MPTKPTCVKMFFCRITVPLDEDLMESLPLLIKTKFYNHPFDEFHWVHETGFKTEKPHYHILILCKTTKVEIQKWIKEQFKVNGNESFAVTDKYDKTSRNESLSYMLKAGLNKLRSSIKMESELIEELKELYRNKKILKDNEKDDKFEYYLNLVKTKLCGNYGDINVIMRDLDYVTVLKKIYYILIKNAISQRKRIMRCMLWDWSFTLTLHLCNDKEQNKLINRTIDEEIQKKLNILE